jgi:hypothetical protein
MAVFLSPGVFPIEIDLSALPTSVGPLRPVFIGTAQKGPINKPTFVSSAQDFINQFGSPIPESPLGFAVLNYMEDGNQAYILRVGIEAETGQDPDLAAIAIDTSGANIQGWGRIPLFTGIDFGRISLRTPSVAAPFNFHDDAVTNITFDDVDLSPSEGPATATLNFVGAGLSDEYTGPIDDSYVLTITGTPGPTAGDIINGATFQVVRNSDGVVTNSGTLVDSGSPVGTSTPIPVGVGADDVGLIFSLVVNNGVPLEIGDIFTFQVQADNRVFTVAVQGVSYGPFTMPTAMYTTTDAFATAFNTLVGSGVPFLAENVGGVPEIVTKTAGDRIQVVSTEGWCLHVGVPQYVFDIPRSHLLAGSPGPFNINATNDRVHITVIGPAATTDLNVSVPDGVSTLPTNIAAALDLGGILAGHRYYNSFVLQVAVSDFRVVVVASDTDLTSTVKMRADFSNLSTLNFAQELEIPFPYTSNYRGFSDPRVALPQSGFITPSVPRSCELLPLSAQCAADSAYFQNIVGFLVAKSPGTWVDNYKVNIDFYNNQGNSFTISVLQNNVVIDRVENVSFDQTKTRYIGNVVNAGSPIGGTNGNSFYQWEARPAFLNNDPVNDLPNYQVRQPVPQDPFFIGGQNGIPTSAVFSSELDAEIIGNPALSTGIFAFQNPEVFDVNLLLIPGNSSGAVIGQGLQLCESRGDMLYIVDPPFGLRPQQVVDWHNGMLFSDLRAAINSSYGALYWPWIKIFNQFDASEIFVPPSGFVASVFSRTARVAEQWFAPAGLNRGRLLTALDVEFNATQGERDLLYGSGNAVNPIVNFPQDGITVFGQRTLQRLQSALDRVNVRMLLIFLKKNLVRLLRFFLFEPIDNLLFAEIKASMEPFLEDVMARRGMTGFKVICDTSNNTPATIDRNEVHVAVLIRPTKAAEFIELDLVILRSDQSFAATEVLQAAGVVGLTTSV